MELGLASFTSYFGLKKSVCGVVREAVVWRRGWPNLDFSRGRFGSEGAGAGRLVGLIVASGHDESAGGARRAGVSRAGGSSGREDGELGGRGGRPVGGAILRKGPRSRARGRGACSRSRGSP